MSDLIRQSVSWPSVHGTRSYSRVTQLGRSDGEGEGEAKEATATRQSEARDEKSGASTTGTRRGGLIDLSV